MTDFALILAVVLLAAGVLATFVPFVPGALLSLAGIYGYWWASGYTEPGPVFLVAATVVGLLAFVVDYLSGVISARISGAPLRSALVAGVVGLALLVLTGPVGALFGVVLTVFGLEFKRTADARGSARTALHTTILMLASSAMQVLLTLSLLIAFLIVVR